MTVFQLKVVFALSIVWVCENVKTLRYLLHLDVIELSSLRTESE